MSKKRVKQYLMLLTVIGLVAIASGGSGTFATFTADVTNPGNTFASGTLFLHDFGGTLTCTSESGTLNVNPGTGVGGNQCDTLFSNVDLTNAGGATAHLQLTNAGTINASDIKFDVSSCSVANNSANTGSGVTFGSAPTCGQLYITVQETQSNYTTDVYCAYGTNSSGACAAPSNAYTLGNTTSLTALQTTGGVNAPLASSASRYYVITITPGGVTNDNTLQNRLITFALTWHLDQ
jgi:hypothetical protein